MRLANAFLICFVLFTAAIGAQTIHEPNSDIYKDIDRWAVQGYIKEFLPLIRPYPVPLIEQILSDVIDNGDDDERFHAEQYMRKVAPPYPKYFNPGLMGYLQGENKDYGLFGAGFVEGLFRIREILSTSYHFGIYGMTDENGDRFIPYGNYSPYADLIEDTANVGPIELRPQWTSITAIGKSDLYFQAGLTRTSVGPFFDNSVVVGPQAPRAGHFSFVIWEPKWSFDMLFNLLGATDDFGNGQYADKYLVMHNISVRPVNNFEIGFIQTLIWGGRFEALYLVPLSFLFASQSIYGFEDNSLMGLHFRWKTFDTFLVRGIAYLDDLHLNELLRGSLRSKAAGQIGISWTPKKTLLSKLDLDYTAVLPFMYTHWNEVNSSEAGRYNGAWNYGDGIIYTNPNSPNYLNYTHLGRSIGSDLQPNSDRVSLKTNWALNRNIELRFGAYFSRHGNASQSAIDEGLMEADLHNGSVLDDGCQDPWLLYGPDKTDEKSKRIGYGFAFWLTQDVIDMRLGGTIGVTLTTIPLPSGIYKVFIDYGLEYGWNRGTRAHPAPVSGNNGFNHTWSLGMSWRY
jgi:hypothetical protein